MNVTEILMPKLVSVEIRKTGFVWKIVINGVIFKRVFITRASAEDYLSTIHTYFGDDCAFILKEAA